MKRCYHFQNIWRSVGIKLKGFIGGESHGLHRSAAAQCHVWALL